VSNHIYKNRQIEDLEGELWVDVIGYDGIYLISNLGRVKSYQREINMGANGVRIQKERIMKQIVVKSSFTNKKEPSKSLTVSFTVDSIKKTFHISTLVGKAFVGDLKNGQVYSKKDKCWHNLKSENLEILSKSDDIKVSYLKGNNTRYKEHLKIYNEPQFIYTRLIDGKEFNNSELSLEYKKDVRTNIKKAISRGGIAYGSYWSRRCITIPSN